MKNIQVNQVNKKERLAELQAKKDPFIWDRIIPNLEVYEGELGDKFLGYNLGSVQHLNPSGKIYTFWTTNQTKRDVERDQAYWSRMEHFANKKGFYIFFEYGDAFLAKVDWEPEEDETGEEEGE